MELRFCFSHNSIFVTVTTALTFLALLFLPNFYYFFPPNNYRVRKAGRNREREEEREGEGG